MFPIPATCALVEQRIADRPGRVVAAQPAQELGRVELVGEDVGPETGQALVKASAPGGDQLERGAVELHHVDAASMRMTSHARRGERGQRRPGA